MRLYVGNLGEAVNSTDLLELFAPYGTVRHAEVVWDFSSGMSRGFGFVRMDCEAEAHAATAALDGFDLAGRALSVNAARPRDPSVGPMNSGLGRSLGSSGRFGHAAPAAEEV